MLSLKTPKNHVGLNAATIGSNWPDVCRLAMTRRHGGQPQLATGNVAKFSEGEGH